MLGTEIDNCVAKALVTKEAPVSLQSRTVLGGTRNQACAELLKYLKKEYKVLNSCQHWSMAPDGGKIGNKGLFLAPLAANGQALTMWAPPQDGGSPFHRLPLHIWRKNDFRFDEKTTSQIQK
jgi:hypothetical protein